MISYARALQVVNDTIDGILAKLLLDEQELLLKAIASKAVLLLAEIKQKRHVHNGSSDRH